MEKLIDVLWVGVGGFIGTILRYVLSILVPSSLNSKFPISTFLSNMLGCFILGIVSELALRYSSLRPDVYVFLTIGLCGGFTTFSALVYEGFHFLRQGNLIIFLLYGVASLVTGFLSLYAGILLTRNAF